MVVSFITRHGDGTNDLAPTIPGMVRLDQFLAELCGSK